MVRTGRSELQTFGRPKILEMDAPRAPRVSKTSPALILKSSELCSDRDDLNSIFPFPPLREMLTSRFKSWMGNPEQGREGVNPYPFMG